MQQKFLKSLLYSTILAGSLSATNIEHIFNKSNCDQVLQNNGFFQTCYDYEMKGAKYLSYRLKGELVDSENIKERPRFYEDKNIPARYRSKYSDYTKNGKNLDRGHILSDASSDYSQRSLKASYVMSNIFPQDSSSNKSIKSWRGLEEFERAIAKKLGYVDVLNGLVYPVNPKRIGHGQIAVPYAYWKMMYNDKENYKRCFYFENKPIDDKKKRVKDYEVNCSQLRL